MLATMKYDLEKSKYEVRHDMKLNKLVLEVFRPSGKSTRVAKATIDIAGAAIEMELVSLAAPLPYLHHPCLVLSRAEKMMRLEEMRARVGRAFSSLALKADEQIIGAIASSESQTLLTPSPATEAIPPDTTSASITTSTTFEVVGVTPP
ncbi:hypothetical protein HAX54_053012 [Datura stramonium]|uniref:Uncharacterized protein n=1 Tax=Datura stramonium TaxID=4076 RepID=A0ABS8T0V3_DATST|nr:hypothetical protein [Datura stramonium]